MRKSRTPYDLLDELGPKLGIQTTADLRRTLVKLRRFEAKMWGQLTATPLGPRRGRMLWRYSQLVALVHDLETIAAVCAGRELTQ